jgi:hypothetical protein
MISGASAMGAMVAADALAVEPHPRRMFAQLAQRRHRAGGSA